ncbi:MAG: alpha/beta hydrolase fold domain-containing protein [Sphingobium sp.]
MTCFKCTLSTLALVAAMTMPLRAQTAPVTVDSSGTVTVKELAVPLSSNMSEEARKAFLDMAQKPFQPEWMNPDSQIDILRALDEADLKPVVAKARARYDVKIVDRQIGNVSTREVTPAAGVTGSKRKRVLIELHGGGFFTGAGGQALLESVPLAALGGYKIIAVDYRQGPEHRYPAATDDVLTVYRALLREYAPRDIGIYGCSAGGSLTAMAIATIAQQGLPRPGAIGILSASAFAGFLEPPAAVGAWGGDSRFTAPVLGGEPPQSLGNEPPPFPKVALRYLEGVDLSGPLVSPGNHPDVLAKFPPTLVLTGTRGFDMSAAIQTHRNLLKAGATAQLNIWDGMGHCFFSDPDLPESKEAFTVMAKFFDRWLTH